MAKSTYRESDVPSGLAAAGEALPIHAEVPDDEITNIVVDASTGAVMTMDDDGGVTIDFEPNKKSRKTADKFSQNLADVLDDSDLMDIANDLLDGIEQDINSRVDWEGTYNRGIDLLGLKMPAAGGAASPGSTSISQVYHPLLLEAVVRFQSNARGELLPADGPVKVEDESDTEDEDRAQMADAFERDMNYYLTKVAKEYYPDFDSMLFELGFSGCTFRKVYHCPLRKRPVSESVPTLDVIVSNDVTDLSNARRVTHRNKYRISEIMRLQIAEYFRDVELTTDSDSVTLTEEKKAGVEGTQARSTRPQDMDYVVYESACELDLGKYDLHEKMPNGKAVKKGLPLPYLVTVDKGSKKVLAIYRNWKQDDDLMMPRCKFIKYDMIAGLGFYGYGFIHLLGNTTRALTAIERMLIDAGQFANFPGFLRAKAGGRSETNVIRIPPGGSAEIDTGGRPINEVVLPLPYKEPSATLMQLGQQIAADGQRLGSTTEINVGEGRADVPVGTTIALIEQATKIESAVHARCHSSQQQEFMLLKELFMEAPEALSKFNKKGRAWTAAEEFADIDLVPASDPNIPSHIHRVMQTQALMMIAQGASIWFNQRNVLKRALTTLRIKDIDNLLLQTPNIPPPPPGGAGGKGAPAPMDPMEYNLKIAELQNDKDETARQANEAVLEGNIRMKEMDLESKDKAADRESRENIADTKYKTEMIKQSKQVGADQTRQANDHQMGIVHKVIDQAHERNMQVADQQHEAALARGGQVHEIVTQAHENLHDAVMQGRSDAKETGIAAATLRVKGAMQEKDHAQAKEMVKAKPAEAAKPKPNSKPKGKKGK